MFSDLVENLVCGILPGCVARLAGHRQRIDQGLRMVLAEVRQELEQRSSFKALALKRRIPKADISQRK